MLENLALGLPARSRLESSVDHPACDACGPVRRRRPGARADHRDGAADPVHLLDGSVVGAAGARLDFGGGQLQRLVHVDPAQCAGRDQLGGDLLRRSSDGAAGTRDGRDRPFDRRSFFAAVVGVVAVMAIAEPLIDVALAFGPPEYFALAAIGIAFVASLSQKSISKGLMMAALGLWLSCIGVDAVVGEMRFTFGLLDLQDGIGLVPAMTGISPSPRSCSGFRSAAPSSHRPARRLGLAGHLRHVPLSGGADPLDAGGAWIGIVPGSARPPRAFSPTRWRSAHPDARALRHRCAGRRDRARGRQQLRDFGEPCARR